MTSGARVDLDVFEGPLDLLLHLVKKHEISLLDIPVAFIAQKYLEYLSTRQAPDLDADSRWLVMAADLISIKARMLIPKEDPEEDDGPDPRERLATMLAWKQAYRGVSHRMAEMAEESGRMVRRERLGEDGESEGVDATLFDLGLALVRALAAKSLRDLLKSRIVASEIRLPKVTVTEKLDLAMQLLTERETVALSDLVGEHGREGLVCAFLALLEMARSGRATVYQAYEFGEVFAARPSGR